MKKLILGLALCAFMSATLFSCDSTTTKVEKAEADVEKANRELEEANNEYLAEIAQYKKETAEKVAANEKSIAEFNARIELQKADARDDYRKKIQELEQKNSDLKKNMNDYKADGKDNWEAFKTEFNRDWDKLGQALKDLTVKND